MWHYLRDPMFSRFDRIPECDRHTHTHRHTTTAYTALSIALHGKNRLAFGDVIDKSSVLFFGSPVKTRQEMHLPKCVRIKPNTRERFEDTGKL